MRLPRLALMTLLAATAAGAETSKPMTPADIEADVKSWRERRLASLTSEEGWLTLVGLDWLEPGPNRFGSAKDNALAFPAKAPPHIGTFTLKDGQVTLALEPGVTVLKGNAPFPGGVVKSDENGEPDVLRLGTLRFFIIKRGERYGIRIKDSEAETRKSFHGIPTFPVNPAWRVEAKWEPAQGRTLAVPNVLGAVEETPSPGTAVFTVNGKEYRLDPVVEDGKLFFVFWDETGKTETYGAGRFLYAAMPKDGKVVLDFNKAQNPPCAFTPYATCPLPPPQNRLKLRVEAGEKRYGDH